MPHARQSLLLLTVAMTTLSTNPCMRAAVDVEPTDIEADLLIVGGTESGWAAAIQAARMGVERIVLVNDIEWLGGQFTAEAVFRQMIQPYVERGQVRIISSYRPASAVTSDDGKRLRAVSFESVGDARHAQEGARVRVEDVWAMEDVATAPGWFHEAIVTLDVDDGRLTVKLGPPQPDCNTCLNWLRIVRVY